MLQSRFPLYQWSLPPDLNHGVLATNQAFLRAKEEGRNPVELAAEIVQEIQEFVDSENLPLIVKNVGPYVNLDLNLPRIDWVEFARMPQLEISSKKFLLEYISPNAAKPLHAGHIRNANLGETLRRILSLKYPDLITDNHWGDWGVQFGILIWAWKKFQEEGQFEVTVNDERAVVRASDYDENPVQTLVKVYIWGNSLKDEVENWEALVRDEFIKLEQGDEENRLLHSEFVEVSKQSMRVEMELLNVPPFDLEQGESFYEPDMKLLWDFMETEKIWKKEGNARFFDLEELAENWPDIHPDLAGKIKNFGRCYLVSSNGYTTYAFRDVAARWQWARDHGADLMMTITGNEQIHNFHQAFSIISYLSQLESFKKFNQKYLVENGREESEDLKIVERLRWENLINLHYGFLSLLEGKMSTRKGRILAARDVIYQIVDHAKQVLLEKGKVEEENLVDDTARKVAIAALKWYDLARDSASDIVLDIPKILSFEGNTGVYQLYTVVRLNSILSNNQNVEFSSSDFNVDLLNDEERLMLKQTYTLPWVLENVCGSYKPHNLCNYLFELATKINSWYVKHSVSNEPDLTRKKTLLVLCQYLRNHLDFTLSLLGIESVEGI